MAKNRVAPEKPVKNKDAFFTRAQPKFKSKPKFNQNKSKFGKKFDSKDGFLNKQEELKPSVSGGDSFFVKANDKNKPSKVSESTQKHDNAHRNDKGKFFGGESFFVKPKFDKASKNQRKTEQSTENDSNKTEKKPFDKKTWRLQKYSKKYKLQQWEDKRKKSVLRGYYRSLKEDEPKLDVQKIYEEHKNDIDSDNEEGRIHEENENNLNASIVHQNPAHETLDIVPKNSQQKKGKAFKKAHQEFQRIKEEKQKSKEEALKKKAEKEEALQAYKTKKAETFKKLNRKTKKGQPFMGDRMEMLLEKIQKKMNN